LNWNAPMVKPLDWVRLVIDEAPKVAVPVGSVPDDQLLPVLMSEEPGPRAVLGERVPRRQRRC
jgi:hypothetical protein